MVSTSTRKMTGSYFFLLRLHYLSFLRISLRCIFQNDSICLLLGVQSISSMNDEISSFQMFFFHTIPLLKPLNLPRKIRIVFLRIQNFSHSSKIKKIIMLRISDFLSEVSWSTKFHRIQNSMTSSSRPTKPTSMWRNRFHLF